MMEREGEMRALLALLVLCSAACGGRPALLVDGPRAEASRMDAPRSDTAISDLEHAVRACVVAASCAPYATGSSALKVTASGCLDELGRLDWPQGGYSAGPISSLARRFLDCVPPAGAVDCKTFTSCYGGDWVSFSTCREFAMCDGAKLKGYKGDLTIDCAVLGPHATCVDLPTGVPRACCTASTCSVAGTTCQGSEGSTCSMSVLFEFDCAPSGRVCSVDPKVGLCQGTGTACDVSAPPTCAGATATYCAGGKLSTVSCAKRLLRSACDPSSSYLPCRPAGSECTPDFLGECADGGAGLVVCVDGRRRTVGCATLGFEVCYPPNAEGRPARCGFLL
jgi:hypothetical protein